MAAKILVFSGSIRTGSFNTKLAKAAIKVLAEQGAEVTEISLADYPLPIMDEDLEAEKGVPENAVKLARLFQAHDGLFIACPEYNASIPPLLKNTLDWISRVKSSSDGDIKPYPGLHVGLGAASPGALGGMRGLYHVRAVLMTVGTQVVSEQASISAAHNAFGDDDMPKDERQLNALKSTCGSLLQHATEGRGRA